MFYKKFFFKSLDRWPTFLAKDATFDFNDAILYIAHRTSGEACLDVGAGGVLRKLVVINSYTYKIEVQCKTIVSFSPKLNWLHQTTDKTIIFDPCRMGK
jgi:hypothetical protein